MAGRGRIESVPEVRAGLDPARAPGGAGPDSLYDRGVMIPPWLLAVALVLGILVLLPARRLHLAGLSSRTIGLYALGLWLLGFMLTVRPVGAQFLVPIVLLAYIAPFVAAPERINRIMRRGRPRNPPRPPMKNVTPPDDPVRPD